MAQQDRAVGLKRVWRRERLTVTEKQPKRGRLRLSVGSSIHLRLYHRNDVWSYDFVRDRTHEGLVFRMLNLIDEYSRESPAIHVKRRLNSQNALHVLAKLFVLQGPPEHIYSDNGPEFFAKAML